MRKRIDITKPLFPAKSAFNKKIDEIWDSQWLTNNGEQHNKLEKKLKEYLGLQNFILFCNGTMALYLGLKAMNLTGEIITTPFTFPATVEVLDWSGLKPVFCDVKPSTLNIDPKRIEPLITEKTSAILAVHVFGNPCDVYAIEEIAKKHQLKVIYDGAHVFGSKINGISIGNFGNMTMFSFHATKLFHTIEGGGLAFHDTSLNEKLSLLKNFGIKNPEEVVLSGINAKMNELQAAMGLEVLKLVEDERKKRRRIKSMYIKQLKNIPGIQIITEEKKESDSYQYFVIAIDKNQFGKSRDTIHEELKKHNIFTRKYFYPLCSNFNWYGNNKSAKKEKLPIANLMVGKTLSLPFYGDLEEETVKEICDLIINNN